MSRGPLISPDEARNWVLDSVRRLAVEEIPAREACGRTLAERLVAPGDFPPFPRVMMDGFAVRLRDAGRTVRVSGEAPAGASKSPEVREGAAVAVMTGTMSPQGAETIVPLEEVFESAGAGAQATLRLPEKLRPWAHISPRGRDCQAGQEVLAEGERIGPAALGLLGALGRASVLVRRRPRVRLLVTGSELVDPGEPSSTPGMIHDSNGLMLRGLVETAGARLEGVDRVRDDPSCLRRQIEDAAGADAVILSGGVSVGRYDLVPRVLEGLGVQVRFHGVSQKPGKPVLFGCREDKLYFGLPGTPLGCLVSFHLYVGPALRALAGLEAGPSLAFLRADRRVEPDPERWRFVPGRSFGPPGRTQVRPLDPQSSSDLFSAGTADVLIRVPPGKKGIEEGDMAELSWLT